METITANISKTSQLKTALTSAKSIENKITEELTITWLDTEKVNILTKIKINVGGTLYSVGNEIHKGYENTENGRNKLLESVKEPFLSAILKVWNYENIAVKDETKNP